MERRIVPMINDGDGAAMASGSMSPDDDELAEELQLQEILFSAFQEMTMQDTSVEASRRPSSIADIPGQSTSSTTPTGDEFYCTICLEILPGACKFSISSCRHAFCVSCIVQHVATKVGQNIVHVPCPEHGCEDGGAVGPEDCLGVVPSELLDRWGLALCEASLGAARLYCPYRDCSAPLVADEEEDGAVEAECPHCHRLFCGRCAVPWHDGVSCEELRELGDDERGREDVMVRALAGRERWQRCPQCRMYVEKSEGCMFMQCRCGYCFCYACASPMSKELHYCERCNR